MVLGAAGVPTARERKRSLLRRDRTARVKMTSLIAHLGGRYNLPPGYYLDLGAEILILRREDGSVVAAFSARGASPKEVARTAEKDYRATGNPSR